MTSITAFDTNGAFTLTVAGWAEHKISSEAGFKGILKKCLILAFVDKAHLMDKYLFLTSFATVSSTLRSSIKRRLHYEVRINT